MEKKFITTEFGVVFGTVVGFLATIGVVRRLGRAAAKKIVGYRSCGKLLTMVKGTELGKN